MRFSTKILKLSLLGSLAGFCLCAPSGLSQDENGESIPPLSRQLPVWEVAFPDEGSYAVALEQIASVSLHKYLLNGTLQVSEVNIVTPGDTLVRFYFIEPQLGNAKDLASAQRAQELIEQSEQRSGVQVTQAVHKKYPETTHSKTIEYSLPSLQALEELHESVRQAWLSQQSSRLEVR